MEEPRKSQCSEREASTGLPSTPVRSRGVNTETGRSPEEETSGSSVWQALRAHTLRLFSTSSWLPSPAEEGQHHIPPGPTATRRVTDCRPKNRRFPLGFSFSPAGLLLPYHLGVIAYLTHADVLRPEVPLSGASAGAIAIAVAALDLPLEQTMMAVYRMEKTLRDRGSTRGQLKDLLEAELRYVLPSNCHEIMSTRKAHASIIYTRVNFWKCMSVAKFTDKNDVIACILASCNIPFYFGKGPVLECRGQWAVDGYFSDRKNFGCPKIPNWERQIRVTPFSKKQVLSHLPDFNVISPELSKYDKQIPWEKFEEFKAYLNENPAPSAVSGSPRPAPFVSIPQVDDRPERRLTHTTSYSELPQSRSQVHSGEIHAAGSKTLPSITTQHSNHVSRRRRSRSSNWISSLRKSAARASPQRPQPVVREASEEDVGELERESASKKGPFSFLAPPSFLRAFTENLTPAGVSVSPPTFSTPTKQHTNSQFDPSSSTLEPASDFVPRHYHEDSHWAETTNGDVEGSGHSGHRRNSHWRRRSHRRSESATQYTDEGLLKFTFTWRDLLNYALKPTPHDILLRQLFDLGRADAFRWVCHEETRQKS
eukprot:Gregarina_sp_Poly_1__5859@NODE_308_length_9647_cov_165_896660_g265_i0_p3_GENE_NODE_308_length_9647_cov_165_896660_g265_i0NODE_308_length_9647_cov_165_896660_g265_i0_p3_ORF_typecomplete_len595_score63_15Patatin/PF01734_22/1_6e03Patatin/PF01734_22/1_1e06_NODE_308_length_9647_cov_165_896660_g265_i036185402